MKMKKNLQILLGVFLVVISLTLLPALPAHAQGTTLEQRLTQYKTDRGINLKIKEDRLKLRCSIAQATLKNVQTRLTAAQTKRGTAYKNISDILNNLKTSLDNQAFETTELKAVIDTFNRKVAEYTLNIDAYKQALDDAIAVDCAQDPHGFKGALETARIYHDKLPILVTDIRQYISNTMKDSLDQIKDQLASGRTTGGDNVR